MANTIQIKRSTSTNPPSSLNAGELAWTDAASGLLYIGNAASGAVTQVAGLGTTLDKWAAAAANVNLNSHKLVNVTDPTAAQDAATKNYVDSRVNGLSWKEHVRLVTAAALPAYTQSSSGATGTLTANANGALSVDSVAVAVGDRILVKNGAAGKDNGIYVVQSPLGDASHPFILLRSSDFNTSANAEPNTAVFASEGSTLADTAWILTTDAAITVDTTSLTFTQFGAGTAYTADESTLHLSGTTFSINSSYTGQTSITTLGTITTGTWNGTTIAVAHGGTGATSGPSALTNLGAAASGGNSDITSLTGLTGKIEAPTAISSSGGLDCLGFTYTASAVNNAVLASAATGNNPILSVTGSDATVGLTIKGKSTGAHLVQDGSGNNILKLTPVGSAVNYLELKSSATTAALPINATGTDTNISINLVPKGTGVIQANGNTVLDTTSTIDCGTF